VLRIWKWLCNKEQIYNRTILFTKISMFVNVMMGLGKILLGFISSSILFVVSGFYNIGLFLTKIIAVKGYSQRTKKNEYHYYQLMGFIMLLASLSYIIGSINVIINGYSKFIFTTIMVIGIGVITGIEILVAIFGYLARKKEKQPILQALKLTSLISSLFGLVLVQMAVLGHNGIKPIFYFDYVGIVLGIVSVLISLYMVISAKRQKTLCQLKTLDSPIAF
jgi:hypothetical protein